MFDGGDEDFFNEDFFDDIDYNKWTSFDFQPVLENFTAKSGLNIEMKSTEISDFVELFIDDQFFENVVIESNRYRAQNIEQFPNKLKCKAWTDIDVEELKRFFALVILMGQVVKDDRSEYWSTDELISTPIFSRTMPRNRFNQIWNALHFSNNDDKTDNRSDKILPIINYFQQKFISTYTPGPNLALIETIVPHRENLANPFKTLFYKFRLCIRVIRDVQTGYISNFNIFCGNSKGLNDIIKELVVPYTEMGYHIYMKNVHSMAITKLLLQKKIRVCGTISANGQAPEQFNNVKLTSGETIFCRNGDILIQHFCPSQNNLIKMISTIHSAEIVKQRNKLLLPACVADLQKNMKNANKADYYLKQYSLFPKQFKWYKKVVFYLINCAFFNAFLLYKKMNLSKSKLSFKLFVRSIAQMWMEPKTIQIMTTEPVQ